MSIVTYEVDGLSKHAEKDSIDNGCIPGTETSMHVDVSFSAASLEELISEIASFVNIEKEHMADSIERDSCGEVGRVDFTVQENDDGLPLTSSEREDFRAGRITTWYVQYIAHVRKVEREVVSTLPQPSGGSGDSGVVN